MSNADLQSELNRIRNDISRVERENNQIRGELAALSTSASSNSANLIATSNNARNAMENSHNTIDYSHEQLKRTFNIQMQIREMYFIFKDVETANKKIRLLNNKLYFDYKNQAMIRKIVRGFMDNLDLDMVNYEIIYKAVEKEYLQAPDYWLAFVLLAIMYWQNDNKPKAEECLSQALKKNNKSVAIFFMLFNLKINRVETALNWFNYYKELDKTGSDNNTFLMFISSVPNRIHDENVTSKIGEALSEYVEQEVEQSSIETKKDGIVSIIYNYFLQIGQPASLKYKNLSQYLQEKQILADVLSKAKNNQKILDFIEELNKVHLNERNIYLNKYIDELISIPSEEEQKIIDEIHYNEEIIATMEPLKKMDDGMIFKSNDFRKLAKENHDKKVNHDISKLNAIAEIINWVYVNKNNDINSLTKWNLFALTKDYTDEAYKTYHNSYINQMPKTFHISVNDYNSVTDFKNCENELAKKDNFIKNKTRRLLQTVKNTGPIASIVSGGIMIVAALVCLILSFALNGKVEFDIGILFRLIAGVSSIIGIFLLVLGLIKLLVSNPRKRRNIHSNMEKESQRLDDIIHNMFEEIASYFREYQEADKLSTYITDHINQM